MIKTISPALGRASAMSFVLAVASCVPLTEQATSARSRISELSGNQRIVVLERPPVIAALSEEEIPLARRIAEQNGTEVLRRRDGARTVTSDALAYLVGAAEGRAFLEAPFPRALARGMPALGCPAAAVAGSPSGPGPSGGDGPAARGEAAATALRQCLALLEPRHTGCGCRVVALDGALTIPRSDAAYATGVTARMRAPDRAIDAMLVAEDERDGATLLRDLNGPVARLSRPQADAAVLQFVDSGRIYEGRRITVGYRRGRLAERVYARNPDDPQDRVSLLIGFPPEELAQRAGAWLAWPVGG